MKKQLLNTLTIALALFISLGSYAQEATISKAACGIDLDGYGDEDLWGQVTAHDINLNYDVEEPSLTTATWKAFWTDTAVFVLIEVSEDSWAPSWISGAADWESDKPEVYFDVNETLADESGPMTDGLGEGNGHYQLAPNFSEETDTTSPGDLIVVHEGEKFYASNRYTPSPTSYSYEYSAAFESLVDGEGTALDPTTRTTIGFDATVIDRDEDGDARNRAVWANSAAPESWENMDGAGELTFGTDELTCPTTAIGDVIAKDNTAVYPSVATTEIYFSNAIQSVEIYNTLGQTVKSVQDEINSLNISELQSGIYIVITEDMQDNRYVTKIRKK